VHAWYGEGARYRVNVVEGIPPKVEQVGSLLELRVDGGGGIPGSGPRLGHILDSTKVTMPEIFSNSSFLHRFLTYGYEEGFIYAIEMIGRSDEDTDGWITCLGGQGFLTQRMWSQGRIGVQFGNLSGQIPRDIDLRKVRSRLEELDSRRKDQRGARAKN